MDSLTLWLLLFCPSVLLVSGVLAWADRSVRFGDHHDDGGDDDDLFFDYYDDLAGTWERVPRPVERGRGSGDSGGDAPALLHRCVRGGVQPHPSGVTVP